MSLEPSLLAAREQRGNAELGQVLCAAFSSSLSFLHASSLSLLAPPRFTRVHPPPRRHALRLRALGRCGILLGPRKLYYSAAKQDGKA